MKKPREQFIEAMNEFFADEEAKSNLLFPKLTSISDQQALEFGKWLGYKYYRVANWKWRQIKDEKDDTLFTIEQLLTKFKEHYGE